MLGTSTLALKRLIAFFGIYSSSWVIRPSETNLQDILSWRHFSSFYGLITHKLNNTQAFQKASFHSHNVLFLLNFTARKLVFHTLCSRKMQMFLKLVKHDQIMRVVVFLCL